MSYRDVLVHLDRDECSEVRLELALHIARTFSAPLTGIFGESDPHVMSYAARDPSLALETIAQRIERDFREQAMRAGVAVRWLTAMTVNDLELIKRMLFVAHHADLVILSQRRQGEFKASVPADLIDHLVLNCGRPILCVPDSGEFRSVGSRVVVAWNGSREATRAVHDALPFLARADKVRLVAVNPDLSRKDFGEEPFIAMRQHLANHGVRADGETLWLHDTNVVEGLLSRAADEAADLLVMGAHGQYGFPHLHRGGTTRELLQSMTVPVLLSH